MTSWGEDMEQQLPKRKQVRMEGANYNDVGAYFITICTKDRRRILSTVGGDVPDAPTIKLMRYGEVANNVIQQMNAFYSHISVKNFVIMPNHIHVLLFVEDDGSSGTSTPTRRDRQHSAVSSFVSTFKRFCNKEYGENIWQRGFYDHIIRSREDYEEHRRYIYENPMTWVHDELYTEE